MDYINYFNLEQFNEEVNNIYLNIKDQYIANINISINNYGIDLYPNNLENKIDEINEKKKKRRGRILTEEEITNIIKEKVADKAIDEAFSKLINSSYNSKIFINSLKDFDEFNSIIENNINKLNYAYKSSLNLIKKNNYEEEIHKLLVQKLDDLKDMTLNYYNNISINFNTLKSFLNNSINDIDNNLNKCANITYITFAEKYDNISKNVESINKENEQNEGEIKNQISVPNQNNNIDVDYIIPNLFKKAKFKFELIFEGTEVKKPIVKISVINESKPKQINIEINEPQNNCGKIIEKVEAIFKDVNSTLNIDFFTNSTELYATTIVDFGSYYVSKQLFEIEEKTIRKCIDNNMCSNYLFCDIDNPIQMTNRTSELVRRKKINNTEIINMDLNM